VGDHFYTTNLAEMQRATSTLGYNAEGITGYIFPTQEPNRASLPRLPSPTNDHFYTINKAESDNAVNVLGYSPKASLDMSIPWILLRRRTMVQVVQPQYRGSLLYDVGGREE